MKFKRPLNNRAAARRRRAGFTLVEVLAAMLLMAVVIPVGLQGVRVASRVGVFGQRKAEAARICERVLNEALVTGQYTQSGMSGEVQEADKQYNWTMRVEPWEYGNLSVMTVEVAYSVQGQEYLVNLSTLVDTNVQ